MRNSTPSQLRFPAIASFTVRADFEGGALSSDFGLLLLRGVEHQRRPDRARLSLQPRGYETSGLDTQKTCSRIGLLSTEAKC
ncbi:hypothetical protein D3C84_643590 [compost metagenome]